jgi:outer membrane protein insertion porin family
MIIRSFLILLFISCFSINNINAQVLISKNTIDYSNPKEYEIGGIVVTGVKYLDQNVLVHISGLKVGEQVYIPGEKITNAIEKLWKQGLFSDVNISAIKIQGGKVFLNIHLQERPRLSKFSFNGVSKGEADDLREDIKLVRGTQITENVLMNTNNIIRSYFIDKGFYNTEVNIVQKNDTLLTNNVVLEIQVDKKEKVKIADIIVSGNEVIPENKIRRYMKDTKRKKWWRIFKASKYIDGNVEEDKSKVIAKYNEKGYRDAEITYDSIEVVSEDRVNLYVGISEGKKYFFRDIEWVGNTIYTTEYLDAILGINKGDIFDQSILDNRLFIDQDAVSSLYLDNGYLFFNVNPVETLVENDSIDLEMQIYEGKQATISNVIITGNTKTNDHVVRREIRTKPGQLFDRSDIIRTNRELAQLGFFDPEKLDVKPTPDPSNGTVDLEYVVEEKPSDQIELSGGFGGGMVIGTLGLTFNNFSAKNMFNGSAWRPLPSGDGQRLSLRGQTNGKYYQAYSLSFVEPWLGGKKPNSFSFSVYHTIRNLGSNLFENEQSMKITGVTLGLGRRLKWPDDFFVLSHSISYQQYKLKDYQYYFIFDNGTSNNISLETTLSRNSSGPNPIYPTTGSLFSFSVQLTPPYSLLNNEDYTSMTTDEKYKWIEYHKWKFKASWFSTLFDKLVLNTKAEFGVIGFYNSDVGYSPFETFNVGGDGLSGYDLYGTEVIGLRGYDSGTSNRGSITPPYPLTGNAYNKLTLELRYPFSLSPSATVYGLVFAEGGNAWYELSDVNPFDFYRSAGVGVRIFLPMFGMLGVDWGYGFDDIPWAPSSSKSQFAFVIGQQF